MVRSDDAARRLKFPYLGPPGWRLWFDYTPAEWGIAAGTWVVAAVAGWQVFGFISGGIPIAQIAGAVTAVVVAHRYAQWAVGRFDFNRPVRRLPRLFVAELTAPRPDNPRRTYEIHPDRHVLVDNREEDR